jgi:ABC-type dipeptide/oligopeptide/nickel transport system permease subunit
MLRHLLPNILPLIIVTATVALPATILAEASLSFLGFGPTGEPSWGQMLSVDGRQYFRKQPGLAVYPGVAIFIAVFGFNMLGDALRDVLDPRLRGSGRQ